MVEWAAWPGSLSHSRSSCLPLGPSVVVCKWGQDDIALLCGCGDGTITPGACHGDTGTPCSSWSRPHRPSGTHRWLVAEAHVSAGDGVCPGKITIPY